MDILGNTGHSQSRMPYTHTHCAALQHEQGTCRGVDARMLQRAGMLASHIVKSAYHTPLLTLHSTAPVACSE